MIKTKIVLYCAVLINHICYILYSIRIVSYNILANVYTRTKEAKKDMFPYCPEEFIVSSYRNPLILKELKGILLIYII